LKKSVDNAREKVGLQHCQFRSMGMLYIKELFMMLLLFDMVPHLPTTCACGKPFLVDHSLHCSFSGFPTIRHNEIRDVTANLLCQVCSNVQIEPHFQPLSGKTLSQCTSNADNQTRLDISAKDFWNTSHELAFIDVRVFNPLAMSHIN